MVGGRITDPEQPGRILTTSPQRFLIYAVDSEHVINVAVDGNRDVPGSIKHEALFHNADVRAAGEMEVAGGIIISVNDKSGTYRTEGQLQTNTQFAEAILTAISRSGASISAAAQNGLETKAGWP